MTTSLQNSELMLVLLARSTLFKVERLRAVEAAVHALRALSNKAMRDKLEAAAMYLERGEPDVRMSHGADYLSNFNVDFWVSCFVDLFPRGDCQERSRRKVRCPDYK